MNRITNEQREAIVREAVAKRDALLAEKPDCAGGSPCTTCPDKRQCAKTGCIRQPEFISAAAQGGQQPAAEVRLTLGMPIIEWVGRDYPVGTKLYTAPAPAAQGGQQPAGVTFPMPDKPGLTMACFDAQTVPVRTPLYIAPAAPAAPLTARMLTAEESIESLKFGASSYAMASVVVAKFCEVNGITLAGTAQKPKSDAERFCDSHCTWMEHHPDCKDSTAQKESADAP